jgi:hypothetical protein
MMKVDKTTMLFAALFAAVVIGYMGTRREPFMQKDIGMPLEGPAMGPYDTAMGGWMSSEHMPVGDTPQNRSLEENKMMFLVGNEVNNKCCPAAFTTDSGCVCLNSQDERLMNTRGGNK